jgi:hypothetical protein
VAEELRVCTSHLSGPENQPSLPTKPSGKLSYLYHDNVSLKKVDDAGAGT